MDTESFNEACSLLPDGVAWGDGLTPEIVLVISEAALARSLIHAAEVAAGRLAIGKPGGWDGLESW